MKLPLMQVVKSRPLVLDTLTTTFWASLGKGAGFLVPLFIAAWFGADSRTDAFFFSFTAVFMFSNIIGRVIESAIVPFVVETVARGESVGEFLGRILGFTTGGAIAATGLLLAVFLPLLPLITRFTAEELKMVRRILILISPLVVLVLDASILSGTLNAVRRFALPAVAPALRAGVMLAAAFLLKNQLGIYAAAVGYLLGELGLFLLLLSAVARVGLRPVRGGGGRAGEFFATAGQQVLGMGAIGLSQVIDKVMASWLAVTGTISILFYAEWLYNIPVIFLSGGLMVTILSHWSERVYRDQGATDGEPARDLVRPMRKALRLVTAVSLLIMIPAVIFLRPIVALTFGRPDFGAENILNLSRVYLILSVTLLADMLSLVMTRVCIIYKQTAIIRNLGLLRLSLKIGFNLLLMPFWGIYGLAVATVLTHYGSLVYLWRKVPRQSG
ncbi:MAG: lipid II flippase MurJ [PVC group bacterium]